MLSPAFVKHDSTYNTAILILHISSTAYCTGSNQGGLRRYGSAMKSGHCGRDAIDPQRDFIQAMRRSSRNLMNVTFNLWKMWIWKNSSRRHKQISQASRSPVALGAAGHRFTMRNRRSLPGTGLISWMSSKTTLINIYWGYGIRPKEGTCNEKFS